MASDINIGFHIKGLAAAKKGLAGIRDDFDRLGKSKGAMNVLQGVGMGMGISAWGMLSSAVGKATDFLGDALQAAIDEEAGVGRLNAALRANIEGWDGNTDAIERGIEARVDLGFADDELRESMTKLVTMTRNVVTAQRAQAAAMDLARYKGIGLVEASETIGKAMAGNKRMLKELGIATSDAGDAYQTLGEIEKAVNGQAAEFAEKTAGRIEAAKARIAGFQDELGAVVVKGADDITTALDFIGYTLTHLEANQNLEQTFLDWSKALEEVKTGAEATSAVMQGDLYTASTLTADTMGELNRMYRASEDALGDLETKSGHWSDAMRTDARAVKRSYKDTADYLLGQYTDKIDTAYGIVEARADLHNAKTDEDRAQAYADLAQLGALGQKGFDEWLGILAKMAKGTKGKVHEAYVAAIKDVQALKAAASGNIKVSVTYRASARPGQAPQAESMGGYVEPGRTYTVGEAGKETLVMSPMGGGYVIPNARGGGSSGGGVPVSIPIVIDGREIARVVDRHLYYEAARAPRSSYAG